MTPPSPALLAEGLTVAYGRTPVLEHVDLAVAGGEVVAVLGESGSGKSTLLRAFLGLVPAPGAVEARHLEIRGPAGAVDLLALGGRGWRAVRGALVGAVFQDSALALTPLRRVGSLLVEAAGQPLTLDEQAERLGACGFADPGPVLAARCWELSGGMAQRVGMALATARAPAVLVADEPTTALDGLARAEVVARLRAVAANGAALVVTTHDVA
ncbi:MAG TPA: ATP-binding cassette domain-containing protein, partial [Acidimicrobiales bacterium]|nr:ATP-binding cassette domain-containing protein [Acidimicrobiales bacterium]